MRAQTLPATVPSHFGFSGRPDAYSGKDSLLILPIIAIAITALFSALLPYPHLFNYPVQITPENAATQYRFGRGLLLVVNAVVVWVFALLGWSAIQVAQGRAAGLPSWFGALGIALAVALPIGVISLIVILARRGNVRQPPGV